MSEDKELVPVETPFGQALMDPNVAHYVKDLEVQIGHFRHQLMSQKIETYQAHDHARGLYQLLDSRPRDRRLAQVLCDWMNLHQEKDPTKAWKICPCALCLETKAHMNALGDPIIHTARGWECTEGREEFQTRNIATEFVDNQIKLGEPIHDTEGVPMDEWPPKGDKS